VIAPTKLTDFTPLYCEQGAAIWLPSSTRTTSRRSGLVKFDFLGLRTLTIIDWPCRRSTARRLSAAEAPVDIAAIPRDDPASYEILKTAQTTAVFQLESRGMKELIKS